MYQTILLILTGFFLIISCQQTEQSNPEMVRHTQVTIEGNIGQVVKRLRSAKLQFCEWFF